MVPSVENNTGEYTDSKIRRILIIEGTVRFGTEIKGAKEKQRKSKGKAQEKQRKSKAKQRKSKG